MVEIKLFNWAPPIDDPDEEPRDNPDDKLPEELIPDPNVEYDPSRGAQEKLIVFGTPNCIGI